MARLLPLCPKWVAALHFRRLLLCWGVIWRCLKHLLFIVWELLSLLGVSLRFPTNAVVWSVQCSPLRCSAFRDTCRSDFSVRLWCVTHIWVDFALGGTSVFCQLFCWLRLAFVCRPISSDTWWSISLFLRTRRVAFVSASVEGGICVGQCFRFDCLQIVLLALGI